MGKASKRKQKYPEDKGIKQPDFAEKDSSSFLKTYGFLITLFLITILAFLIYSNTFSSPFQFDDTPNIVENYKLRDLSNFWPPSGTRYIGFLSFALNYHFNELNVFGYHLLNIIIHIINSILVWWLVIITFRTPVMERINSQLKYFIALTVSLLFVSHPVQTQAVTYIVQRFTSLTTFFYLLSLALYIKARLAHQNAEVRNQSTEEKQKVLSLKSVFCYLLSVFSAILAMKTKEIGFTLPFVVALYEFMFFSPPFHWGQISNLSPKEGGLSLTKRLLYLIPFLLTLLIIPLSLIGTDKPVGDIIGELREAAQETEEIPRNIYLLTQFRVIVTYIRLLFLPINQNLDYDYPLSHSLFEPATFLSFLFLISIFALAVYLLSRNSHSASRIISFGILWFFITLSVESSIIPIRDVIFEHRLYLPSVGAVIAFSSGVFYGISYTQQKLDIKVSLFLATCVLLLVTAFPLGVAAYKRNFVWRDEVTLWEDVVRKSQKKARGYYNIGNQYRDMGQLKEAMSAYQIVLKLKPNLSKTYVNIGNIYLREGFVDEAIRYYRHALDLNPDDIDANYNLGIIYKEQGVIDEAKRQFEKIVRLNPDDVEAHYNLGVIYQKNGLLREAIKEYKNAVILNPKKAEVHYGLGLIYTTQGWLDEAIREFQEVIRLQDNQPYVYNNLGGVYLQKGLIDESMKNFLFAIKLKPDYVDAHFNLGIAYLEKGLKDEARKEFETVLRLKPNDTQARKKIKSIRK